MDEDATADRAAATAVPSATLTRSLAAQVHDLASGPLDSDVSDVPTMAARTLVNVLATAIGASANESVDLLVVHALETSGPGAHTVVGRSERLGLLDAALVNGFAAHLDDFDDTHLTTVIHPGAATMAAALAVAEARGSSGVELLRAFAWGCEVQLRVGVAMSPEHYDDGWHITGTCAPLGAAVAAGLLLGADVDQLAYTIGLAASQTLGQREGFGTMLKPLHPGKGAANGLRAAVLADHGFTAPTDVLEDPRGYFAVLSPNGSRPDAVLDGLGTRFELLENTFKPYPCGIVSHPVIDAGLEIAPRLADLTAIREVVASVNPLVVELTGNLKPSTGLEARFSTAHSLAASLVDGRAGLAQYQDERVLAGDVSAVRSVVRFDTDDEIRRDEAWVRVVLHDGTEYEAYVPHARGSLQRPLTDDELRAKVRDLTGPVLGERAGSLWDEIDRLEHASGVHAVLAASTPKETA